jgi:DNA-directed RNA polymerase specialized sigma24 family protein
MAMPLRSLLESNEPLVRLPAQPDPAPSSAATWRERRLRDPKLREVVLRSLRRALRRKGLPLNDLDDLLNETLGQAAHSDFLPDDDEHCPQYVCGVARNVVADYRVAESKRVERDALDIMDWSDRGPSVGVEATEIKLTIEPRQEGARDAEGRH